MKIQKYYFLYILQEVFFFLSGMEITLFLQSTHYLFFLKDEEYLKDKVVSIIVLSLPVYLTVHDNLNLLV